MIPEIGPRQTVDRAKHPTLGDGRLVHRNGPAFFIADIGELVALTHVDMGGSSSNPRRSWYVAYQDGKRIELDHTDMPRGDRHDRVHASILGDGWLVWVGGMPGDRWIHRFEVDGGKPFEFDVHQMWVGLPEHKDANSKKANAAQSVAADAGWRTMSGDGFTFVYCHEADKTKALHYLEHRNDPKPEKPKRGRSPRGPMPDFANMTREQIKAWQEGAT